MDAPFDFLKYTINRMEYNVLQTKMTGEVQISTNTSVQRNLENASLFRLNITVCVEGDRHILLELFGFFEWKGEYVQDDTESSIMTYGTTILYPYARSAISCISILDGGDPIIIPTINPFDKENATEEASQNEVS